MTDTIIKDTTANPAPLALLGAGMATILLNLHNAGLIPLSPMILAMGFFYGGLAQIIVGILEWKKGNTFGCTAFTSYGVFWLALVGMFVMPQMGWWDTEVDATSMGCFLLIWGIFTLVMFIGTFKINRSLQIVFGTLTPLFFLLAAGKFTGSTAITILAGWEGVLCGATSMYVGLSQVLGELKTRDRAYASREKPVGREPSLILRQTEAG